VRGINLSYPGFWGAVFSPSAARIRIPCRAVIRDIPAPLVAKAGPGFVATHQCTGSRTRNGARSAVATAFNAIARPEKAPAVSFS